MDYNQLLLNKTAFITTGARGIGRAIALLFAKQGATVLVGGKNRRALKETVEVLRAISPRSSGYEVDLSQAEQTEAVCRDVISAYGGIDILVNTVGINARGPAHTWEDSAMDRLFETNYLSGMRCVRQFLPGMIERKNGSIVNISSIHSEFTMPGNAMYAATKGAMNASARAMALDYARAGVRVNNICPGLIMSDTLMDEVYAHREGIEREEFLSVLDGMQPLEPGKVEDIAHAALFFASELSAYVTGQTLFVDGGASIKAHP